MKSLAQLLNDYAQQHQSHTNKLTHYIGIPAILIGALFFLNWISIPFALSLHLTFAWIAIILLAIYYFALDMKLAIAATIVLVIINVIVAAITFNISSLASIILFLIFFVGGWVLQFIGHSMEKSKPAFMKNLLSFPIAPLFVFIELLRALKMDKFFDLPPRTPNNPVV